MDLLLALAQNSSEHLKGAWDADLGTVLMGNRWNCVLDVIHFYTELYWNLSAFHSLWCHHAVRLRLAAFGLLPPAAVRFYPLCFLVELSR